MSVPDETILQSLATVSYTKQVAGTWQVEQVRDTCWSKDDIYPTKEYVPLPHYHLQYFRGANWKDSPYNTRCPKGLLRTVLGQLAQVLEELKYREESCLWWEVQKFCLHLGPQVQHSYLEDSHRK